jgi:hypothetical protein
MAYVTFFCLICAVLNTCVVGDMSTVFNSEIIGLVTVKSGFRDNLMSVRDSAK